MGNEMDEDSIEATIRRVAEAKAARASGVGGGADQGAPAPGEPDTPTDAQREHLVEAMVRRVADAKAARAADPQIGAAPPAQQGTADEQQQQRIEMMVRRVAEAKAARLAEDQAEPASAMPGPTETPEETAAAEDLIEATIRRVAAEKAAQSTTGEPGDEPSALTEDGGAAEPESAQWAVAAEPSHDPPAQGLSDGSEHGAPGAAHDDDEEDVVSPMSPPPSRFIAPRPPPTLREEPAPAAASAVRPMTPRLAALSDDPDLAATVKALRGELDATRRAVEALAARVDALTEHGGEAVRPAAKEGPVEEDEEWDDAPVIPRIPLGQVPRPAIFRDAPRPVAMGDDQTPTDGDGEHGTAARGEETPPPSRAASAPPARPPVEPRRGLDLLPRTYRVTVEDKRRGVDLVPLHRALLGLPVVRDMSLLSYSNGVAIVSLDTLDALDADDLCRAIATAMSRDAKVEVHNEQTMVVKLAEE